MIQPWVRGISSSERRWTTGLGRANDVRAGEEKRDRIYLVDRSSNQEQLPCPSSSSSSSSTFHLPPYRPIFAFVFGQFPARQIFAPPTRGCRSATIEILLLLLLSILRTSASSKRVAHFGERERSAITLQVSASFLSFSNFTILYFSEENFGKKLHFSCFLWQTTAVSLTVSLRVLLTYWSNHVFKIHNTL